MSTPKSDYETLTIQEIYCFRHWAGKTKNSGMLEEIKNHLNARCEALGTNIGSLTQAIATLDEILIMSPPEICIVVDHEITDTEIAEHNTHELAKFIQDNYAGKISVSLHYGELPEINHRDRHVVLLAQKGGFFVLKARGTTTAGKALAAKSYKEMIRNKLQLTNFEAYLLAGSTGSSNNTVPTVQEDQMPKEDTEFSRIIEELKVSTELDKDGPLIQFNKEEATGLLKLLEERGFRRGEFYMLGAATDKTKMQSLSGVHLKELLEMTFKCTGRKPFRIYVGRMIGDGEHQAFVDLNKSIEGLCGNNYDYAHSPHDADIGLRLVNGQWYLSKSRVTLSGIPLILGGSID